MSESAEFEKLTTLEARLAAALDRIAAGVSSGQATAVPAQDPGITSAALEDAVARALNAEAQLAEATQRASTAEAELSAARKALDEALAATEAVAASEERDALAQQVAALEAARTADRDEASRILAERDQEIAKLRADAAADDPADVQDPSIQRVRGKLNVLRTRANRWKTQRNELRLSVDQLRDELEELRDDAELLPEERVLALRAEAARLRSVNAQLLERLESERPEGDDPDAWDDINTALRAEVDALREARGAEASELDRVLREMAPKLAEGSEHA